MDPYITVTPKHVEKEQRLAKPLLTYHGGQVIQNAKVVTIYWGSAWASDPLRTQMDEFFDFVVTSSLIDQLGEYSIPGQTIGHGTHAQSVLISMDPPNPIDDTGIQQFLQQGISGGTFLAPDANTIYFFFMPKGFTVTLQGSQSCIDFCGYHNATPDGLVYAVDTYDDCTGCQFVHGDLLGSSTSVASHELCEMITDPQLDAWFDDNTGDEIGDICEPQTKVINVAGLLPNAQTITVENPLTGTMFNVSVNPAALLIDGTATVQLNITLTPQTVTPPPPPPPPPGTSWTVQKEWSNVQGACV